MSMIRNGSARRLQAQAERSRLTERWQGYPQPVRQSLQTLLRDHGVVAAQLAIEALVEYAASNEAAKEVQDSGLSLEGGGLIQGFGNLKGRYQDFSLQTDTQSLLPPGQFLVVDIDFEMMHLMQQAGLAFLRSMRSTDVELAIILPLLHAWPVPVSYETLYESLCMASWQGTFREFERGLPLLQNVCAQKLHCFGMEIEVGASSLQLVPFT